MTTYTAIVQENILDVQFLMNNHYDPAVAREVLDGNGTTVANTIYRSGILAPIMSFSWVENYGLNFTTNVPAPGSQVTYSGNWQACQLGQAYTLGPGGLWTSNTADAKPGFLTARNGYQDVCITVGIRNPNSGAYTPIYFSPSKLTAQGLGNYQPQENIKIWFGFNQQSGNVIAVQQTAVAQYDMANAQQSGYEHWFQWTHATDSWSDQSQPYPH